MTLLNRFLLAGFGFIALTSVAEAGEPLAARLSRPGHAQETRICRPLIDASREAYQHMTPVKLTGADVDPAHGSIGLKIAGISRPVTLQSGDPASYGNIADYAEYLRDRVGSSAFDSWTGTTPADDKAQMAAKLTRAQFEQLAELAGQALAGTAEIVLRDTRSAWSPTGEPGQSFQLTLYEVATNGCVDRNLGGAIPRGDLDAALLAQVMAAEGT